MATSYKPISWGNEYISSDKLNIMTSNDQYLFEHMPTVYYNANGIRKQSGGMKIMTGVVPISSTTRAKATSKAFYFGSFFSQGCKPIVTTSISMGASLGTYHVTVDGLGGPRQPDHRGMRVRVFANARNAKNNRIHTNLYVHFIAIGY